VAAVVVLIVETDAPLLRSEKLLYEYQGYSVLTAESREKADRILASELVDAVILGHSLSQEDREVLVARTRLVRPEACVLVFHASGAIQPVPPDAAVDSREGPQHIVNALSALLISTQSQSRKQSKNF